MPPLRTTTAPAHRRVQSPLSKNRTPPRRPAEGYPPKIKPQATRPPRGSGTPVLKTASTPRRRPWKTLRWTGAALRRIWFPFPYIGQVDAPDGGTPGQNYVGHSEQKKKARFLSVPSSLSL